MEDRSNEYKEIIEKICKKYNYDNIDKEGNDSLKTVLLKILPAMLKDTKKEERDLFYQMLSHTPIVITENLNQQTYDRLIEQYIGKDINKHIIQEETDLGEYGKQHGEGAYVSDVILDEEMNLLGKKSFIYIQRVKGRAKEFYGTDINVAHLIHELGHAWHAEKDEFIMQPDETLKNRVGTAEFIYSFSKTENDKYIKKCEKVTGLMIEESMNTIEEEKAMANYMGISLEEMKKEYNNSLIPSNYQGYMAEFVNYMLEKLNKDDFEKYRLYGGTENKNKINSLMEKTDYWTNREIDILPTSDSPRSYDKKRAILDSIDSTRVQDFFKEYESIFFPDISKMTPIEKIDNVLEQKYNLNMERYNMGIDNYSNFLERLGYEGYSLINQAATLINLKNKQESLGKTKENKGITINTAVKNALIQGTTTEQVNKANSVEQSKPEVEHINEGETIDD